MSANNAFKPNSCRSANGVAGTGFHVVGYARAHYVRLRRLNDKSGIQ